MPRYYCDYCDAYLTHDSASVRKTHNQGRKHRDNVRAYYQKWVEDHQESLAAQGFYIPPPVPALTPITVAVGGFPAMPGAAGLLGMAPHAAPAMPLPPGMLPPGLLRPGMPPMPPPGWRPPA
eukprot:comp12170_c0_seq1/m.6930 comp12170_c0_seq1/g.6930  ORF comp12170_c0_seq1/g.6930 comp12170_c0_seq1/m.6930 type:complete len:122 (-) comp12170_c0_seq1:85-450(-)